MSTKKCYYCAEEINAQVAVCPFCQRDLTVTPAISHPEKGAKRKKRKIVLSIFAILMIGMCFFPSQTYVSFFWWLASFSQPALGTPQNLARDCDTILSTRRQMTQEEWNEHIYSPDGLWVMEWSGTVTSVLDNWGFSGYGVSVRVEPGCKLMFNELDKEVALSYDDGQRVIVTGKVQTVMRGFFFDTLVTLQDRSVEVK